MSDVAIAHVATVAPAPLARFDGESRFQAALDADTTYQRLVMAALVLAAAASSGFGALAQRGGVFTAVAWSIFVAGLLARAAAPRGGIASRLGAPAGTIVLLGAPAVAVLVSFASGSIAVTVIVATAVIAVLIWLLSRPWRLSALTAGPLLLAIGGAAGVGFAHASGVSILPATATGVALATVAAAASYWPGRGVDAVAGGTRLAGLAWACLAWGGAGPGRFDVGMAIITAALVLAIDYLTLRRRIFAAVAATAIFVQLAALPPSEALLSRWLWLQPAIAGLAFVALAGAGLRSIAAALQRQPSATYRIAPQCVVPRLDRGLDHPVKINVA